MPPLTRYLLRLSLVALLAGSAIGAWRLSHSLIPGPAWRMAHIELMLFGWLVPFVLGTGYWMLPRAAVQPERGNPCVAWAGALLLTAGLGAVVVAALLDGPRDWPLIGAGVRSAGIFLLVLVLWPRVKPFRNSVS